MSLYRVAELVIRMDTFGRTAKQAEPYRIIDGDCKPDFTVCSAPELIRNINPNLSMDDCEYLSTGSSFYRQLTAFRGMLLHASCVVVDGKAYLFSAPCGTGKSTHVALWLKLFGERAYILNDDKPAIRIVDDGIFAYGTPWSGKNDCSRNERVALGGIAVVKRAKENSIRRLQPDEAVYSLMDQTTHKLPKAELFQLIETLGKVVETGKVYALSCNMDISAAKLSYETMSEKRLVK